MGKDTIVISHKFNNTSSFSIPINPAIDIIRAIRVKQVAFYSDGTLTDDPVRILCDKINSMNKVLAATFETAFPNNPDTYHLVGPTNSGTTFTFNIQDGAGDPLPSSAGLVLSLECMSELE